MRVWIEGREINVERYEAFASGLPFFCLMPQLDRMGEFPEIAPTPAADKDAWTDELIARIKRNNGLLDGPPFLVSTPSLTDESWVRQRFIEGEK